MPSTSAPFGLRSEQHISGYGTRGVRAFPGGLPTGYTSTIYQNQPVKLLTTGYIAPVTATEAFMGTFVGVEYTDTTGRRRESNYWPANTAATDIVVYFVDDPNMIYEIQADGSVAQSAVGDQVNFSNLTNGSTTTGLSQCTVSATPTGSGVQGQLRIIDKSYDVNNDWGDAYTTLRVMVAYHQFVYPQTAI